MHYGHKIPNSVLLQLQLLHCEMHDALASASYVHAPT
jgi:hypothetical protein